MSRKAAFVLGTLERDALKYGNPLLSSTVALVQRMADEHDLDVEVVIAVQDEMYAGRPKAKVPMHVAREERERVVSEISRANPDFVLCFGLVAAMCVFDKGNVTEDSLMRRANFPLGPDLPVHYTFSLENVRRAPGLEQWLFLDLRAAVEGHTETEQGEYDILQPKFREQWEQDLFKPIFFYNPNISLEFEPGKYVPLDKVEGVQFVEPKPTVIGLDTETYSHPAFDFFAKDARLRMVQLTHEVGRAWVVQLTPDSGMPDWLRELIEDPQVLKVGSNSKYDYKWLRRFGVRMRNFEDTSTREHLIDVTNPKKDLKSLTFKYLPRLGDYSRAHKELAKERGSWEDVTDEEQYAYAAADAEASLAAWQGQEAQLQRLDGPRRFLKEVYEMLAEVEFQGVRIDLDENRRLDDAYKAKLREVSGKITAVLGPINLNSHVQLRDALRREVPGIDLTFKEWRAVLGDDESPETSTRREILEREAHKHPVVKHVLDYRKYEKRHSNFIRSMHDKHVTEHHDGAYLHCSYRTDQVETGRLSATNPPMHNIPKDDSDEPMLSVKRQFVSRFAVPCKCLGHDRAAAEGSCPKCGDEKVVRGQILAADLKQAEFRWAAWEAQDPAMLDAIAAGDDVHQAMAARGTGKTLAEVSEDERYIYKTITFLTLYGGRAKRLVESLAKTDKVATVSLEEARAMIREYWKAFPVLRDYIDKVGKQAVRDLYVRTAFGFERRFVQPFGRTETWAVQRAAFNTRVQNGAAWLALLATVWLFHELERRNLQSQIIILRHDEYVLDVYPGEEEEVAQLARHGMEVACVQEAKQYGVDFTVPLQADVKIGPSWGELHELGGN